MSTNHSLSAPRNAAGRMLAPVALAATLALTSVACASVSASGGPVDAAPAATAPAQAAPSQTTVAWPASWTSINLPVAGVTGVVMYQGKALVTHETASGYQASLVDQATGRRSAVLVSASRIDVAGTHGDWIAYLRTAKSAKEARQWEVRAYNPRTKQMRVLAYGTKLAEDWGPNPSIGAGKIVWTQVTSWRSMTTNLYVHDLATGKTRLLVSGSSIISPQVAGSNVIYALGTLGAADRSQIFRVPATGGHPVPLTAATTFAYAPQTSSTGAITYVIGKTANRLVYLRPGDRARILPMMAATLAQPLGNLVFIPGTPNKLLDPATGKVQTLGGNPGWFSAGTASKYAYVYNVNPDVNRGYVLRISRP